MKKSGKIDYIKLSEKCIFVIIPMLIGAIGVLISKEELYKVENISNIYLIISGIIMSLGIVVPGISSTVILNVVGIYNIYINALSTMNLEILLPLGVGVIIGGIACIKLVKYLFEKCFTKMFYIVIGFTLGSIFILIPSVSNIYEFLISIFFVMIGFNVCKMIKV